MGGIEPTFGLTNPMKALVTSSGLQMLCSVGRRSWRGSPSESGPVAWGAEAPLRKGKRTAYPVASTMVSKLACWPFSKLTVLPSILAIRRVTWISRSRNCSARGVRSSQLYRLRPSQLAALGLRLIHGMASVLLLMIKCPRRTWALGLQPAHWLYPHEEPVPRRKPSRMNGVERRHLTLKRSSNGCRCEHSNRFVMNVSSGTPLPTTYGTERKPDRAQRNTSLVTWIAR
mmetsp:Transcript_24709/g.78922  ORF Transcript_24709/g.78922 Transcript_24709/m.78922 type:complete len:229 (-) Transcript_24709:662-1348(-)